MDRHDHPDGPSTAADWDERYRHAAHGASSASPNEVLVAEVGPLPPGRALEVACGEGVDAIWLAENGWRVTALDVSGVALDRAAAAAADRGLTVDWVHGAFEAMPPEPGAFDLVVTLYPALPHRSGGSVVGSLISAVATGGTLLVVHHALGDPSEARSHGFDPAAYVQPSDVAARLGDGWVIEVDETRARTAAPSHGPPHAGDVVLKARRRR